MTETNPTPEADETEAAEPTKETTQHKETETTKETTELEIEEPVETEPYPGTGGVQDDGSEAAADGGADS